MLSHVLLVTFHHRQWQACSPSVLQECLELHHMELCVEGRGERHTHTHTDTHLYVHVHTYTHMGYAPHRVACGIKITL